jgi:hypothetical protein
MSWKSFVTAGLLCAVASPVFAVPSLQVTNMGLNSTGDWVWRVTITPTDPLPGGVGGTPLAAEVGFAETVSTLLDANNLSTGAGDDFDTVVPGNIIWSWEDLGAGIMFPEGLQSNCAGGGCTESTPGDDPNTVFAALGSQVYTTGGAKDFIEIITDGPTAASFPGAATARTSTITWRGAYNADGTTGGTMFRIAEYNAAGDTTVNYQIAGGMATRTATAGDTNLANGVNLDDLLTVLAGQGNGVYWQQGNFHGNGVGTANLDDLLTVLAAQGQPSTGGGSGGGSAIPEPATAALISLGIFSVLGLASRKRK